MPPKRPRLISPRVALRLRSHRLAVTRVLAVAAAIRDRLATAYGYAADSIDVISNGVDSRRFAPDADMRVAVRAELGIPADALVFGSVGRLDRVKRIDVLLRALALTTEDGAVNSHLVIAGAGPEESSLQALVDELGLSQRVHWQGWTDDVPALMTAFDAFAIVSEVEATPYTVLEAMASELPVVATRVGELPSVIRHGENGLLTAGDPLAVAMALREIMLWSVARRHAAGVASRDQVVSGHDAQRQAGRVADWIARWRS